ncbi:beta strand repeat-containing protein [Frigoriglobus tundricola]|uniref:Right handed beta helix domain-containing protein n=1 Tax=Frigoriglobus tundricola TaxID=2774151 RepID=A0A6M5YTM9_9BACT|nr:right-handed parallel beta-helix repeat-containing protein [Frigoriglobus tundricola]QJW97425.1 hypothetical protein FTUN_4999 [Frigoriglobus tundricola]
MIGSFWRRWLAQRPAPLRRPRPALRPRVEALECRCVPATLVVDPSVPSDYQNISAAVAAANTGDIIQVAAGTYSGVNDLDLTLNKAITIESANGAASTIIDCSASNFAIVNADCTIQGFTFKNANSSDLSVISVQISCTITGCAFENDTNLGGNGAAFELTGGTSTISNCTFDHCAGAGAISARGGSADISSCTFTNGNGQNGGAGGGGAINLNNGNVTITGSTFTGNTGGNQAGGVFFWRNGALTVTLSTFTNNTASYGGVILEGAQGIDSPASFSQCTFSGNSATIAGGVASLEAGSSGTTTFTATNCLFLNNSAPEGAVIDAKTAGAYPNVANVINSSFYGNQATGGGNGTISGGATSTVNVTNSILYGDLSPVEISTADPPAAVHIDHTDIQGGHAGTGNLNADPLYVNPVGGDLRVQGNSPAVNAGTTGTGIPAADFLGTARDPQPDLGAYEYVLTVTTGAIATTQYSAFTGAVATFTDSTSMTAAVSAFTATIDWGDGTGTSAGTVTQPGGAGTPYVVSGTHTYTTFGPETLTVTVAAVTTLGSGTSGITVNQDVVTHFVVTAPTAGTAGTAFGFTVTAADAAGSTVPGYTGTVHFTSSDGRAVLPGDGTLTNGSGTFTATLNSAGQQTISAADTVTSSVAGSTGSIGVAPVVTASTAGLAADTPEIVIHGSGFDPNVANDRVAFNNGAAGTVTAASPTALTVTLTTRPAGVGGLTAIVTVDTIDSGPAVQVATVTPVAYTPTVAVAFGPLGEVLEVVDSAGVLTQYDATGAHVISGGVRGASVAFEPTGEVLLVTFRTGALVRYDPTGTYVLNTSGVQSASLTYGPFGEAGEVVDSTGQLTRYDAAGAHALAGGVSSASLAQTPFGEVLFVTYRDGSLVKYDATGAHAVAGGVSSASLARVEPAGEVLYVLYLDGSLVRYDARGARPLGTVA